MQKKIVAASIVFLFALSIFSGISIVTVRTSSGFEIPDSEPIDIGPKLRANKLPINLHNLPENLDQAPTHHSSWEIGDVAYWLALDDYFGYYFLSWYQLVAIGDLNIAEIWVQVNLGYPLGDPRDPPIILPEQIDYLLNAFETHIYPTDTTNFGTPDFHDGKYAELDDLIGVPPDYWYEESGRNVILVSNIRDTQYYDPTYPYFVAGFYSPSYEFYMDRNIISIDSKEWWRRVGPEGTEWEPGKYVERPYDYESLIAHEYQHLIHDDYNPDDPSFMNEACSMYAEILCGYPVPWGHINSYLYTPDNSLTEWGDHGGINILADYGASALLAIYLSDHYGGAEFLGYFVQKGIPGIEGINAALKKFNYKKAPGKWMTFDDVYHDWRIANLIHSDFPGDGKYNYKSIDLNSPEAIPARTYDFEKPFVSQTKGTDFGSTITILDYDTGVYKLGSYGSDYIRLENMKTVDKHSPTLVFDGDDVAGVSWIREDMDGDRDLEWYSTSAGNLADLSIIAEVDLTAMATATLTFDTSYNIESLWDFGFVQVSADGGATWVSLANPDTIYDHDPNAHQDIIANLPGFTGSSDGWVIETFDLAAWVGMTIMLRFRYMTDWVALYPGWWVDNIEINSQLIDDADTTVSFEVFPPLPEADFMVTVIGNDLVEDMSLDDLTESGMEDLSRFIGKDAHDSVLIIISSNQGHADYTFSVTKK